MQQPRSLVSSHEPGHQIDVPHAPVPRLNGGLPLLGHALTFNKDPLGLLMRGWREHGDLFEFCIAGKNFYVFAGPEAHIAYFNASDQQLSAKEVYQFTVPIFGKGVAYDVSAEMMQEQLGFLVTVLRDSHMQAYAGIMHQESLQYTERWGDEGEIELSTAMNELTMNIASHCLLGAEVRNHLDSGFARLYKDLQGGINTVGFFLPYLPIPAHRRRDRARREISELIGSIIADRRKIGSKAADFLQALMDACYSDGRCLTDEEIIGLLLTVLFAGQHTSGVLATWTGVELLQHRVLLRPVLDELNAVYGGGHAMTLDTLKKQPLLDNVVREGERMHPPLIFLVRKVLQELKFRDFTVPPGAMAAVSPLLSHRLPSLFRNPDRFDPSRFAPPREEHKKHRYSLIGFGGGRHKCLGNHFAFMQIKAIWTVLLSQFDLELVSSPPRPDYGSWVTGPGEPCMIRYRRRTH